MPRICAGVSCGCMYPEYPEVALKSLCERGVSSFELFLNTHSELEPEYIQSLKDILKSNGAECVSLHPFTCVADTYMLYTGYERRTRDYIEYHKRYFEAMNILGAKYFILHGCRKDLPDSVVFEGYSRLNETAGTFGVQVLQENVYQCATGRLDRLVRMKKALGDNVGFVLDVKQAVLEDLDPLDFVDELGSSIKHVHFSDHGKKGSCLLPGEGEFSTEQFVSRLMKAGYTGAIMLEVYRKAFKGYDELTKGVAYIQNVIDELFV